ncbi:MAG: hypothetical protein A2234_06930 [Elusimicrobia bacterium RIFOXYA2_FULL_58_8]|nr:MAG: hypothetical protein A2285_00365 [Elusimicrobia bacterium RIFOXYA12_FULL_57_11]OGS16693.1 MAG: hypothetical protein A2234_06930 [Elusimicrobia bacterium RIFOXYA2_FULL_58_8]
MPYWKKMIDEMTPEERFNRVVEILTQASLRLLGKQRAEAAGQNVEKSWQATTVGEQIVGPPPEEAPLDYSSSEVPREPPRRGRVPFGHRKYGEDRQIHEIELSLVKDIQRLAAEGLSSEQIAQRLNQDDKVSKRAGKWSRTAVWRILKRLKA